MNKELKNLSEDGKTELALAIILWKDFKTQGKLDPIVTMQAIEFTKLLDIQKQYNDLLPKVPPMTIKERF